MTSFARFSQFGNLVPERDNNLGISPPSQLLESQKDRASSITPAGLSFMVIVRFGSAAETILIAADPSFSFLSVTTPAGPWSSWACTTDVALEKNLQRESHLPGSDHHQITARFRDHVDIYVAPHSTCSKRTSQQTDIHCASAVPHACCNLYNFPRLPINHKRKQTSYDDFAGLFVCTNLMYKMVSFFYLRQQYE